MMVSTAQDFPISSTLQPVTLSSTSKWQIQSRVKQTTPWTDYCSKLECRYEYVRAFEQSDVLLPNTWIVVRIDGRGFKRYVFQHSPSVSRESAVTTLRPRVSRTKLLQRQRTITFVTNSRSGADSQADTASGNPTMIEASVS